MQHISLRNSQQRSIILYELQLYPAVNFWCGVGKLQPTRQQGTPQKQSQLNILENTHNFPVAPSRQNPSNMASSEYDSDRHGCTGSNRTYARANQRHHRLQAKQQHPPSVIHRNSKVETLLKIHFRISSFTFSSLFFCENRHFWSKHNSKRKNSHLLRQFTCWSHHKCLDLRNSFV